MFFFVHLNQNVDDVDDFNVSKSDSFYITDFKVFDFQYNNFSNTVLLILVTCLR